MTCQHGNNPCPECAGFDMYMPKSHEPVCCVHRWVSTLASKDAEQLTCSECGETMIVLDNEKKPVTYTLHGIGECAAKEMQKKLCLDGYGCWCEVMDLEKTEDVEAWGAMFWYNQAGYWMDKYMEAERANKELRGKGMLGLRPARDDESNAEEETWCI